jgi:hypothetical protein
MIACKICQGEPEIQGYVDSGRSCETRNGTYLPLTGTPVKYLRCTDCGFLFTTHFDDWTFADFRREIYNEDYPKADPGWTDGIRAREGAKITAIVMGQYGYINTLDYGGGKRQLTRALRKQGIDAVGCDPVLDDHEHWGGIYDLVTAFEVAEHTPTPRSTISQALTFVAPDGRFLFTTCVCDQIPRQETDWWYIAPRNGHVSIYSSKALAILFDKLGWKVAVIGANTFLAERK